MFCFIGGVLSFIFNLQNLQGDVFRHTLRNISKHLTEYASEYQCSPYCGFSILAGVPTTFRCTKCLIRMSSDGKSKSWQESDGRQSASISQFGKVEESQTDIFVQYFCFLLSNMLHKCSVHITLIKGITTGDTTS